jgi:hypothetical protein
MENSVVVRVNGKRIELPLPEYSLVACFFCCASLLDEDGYRWMETYWTEKYAEPPSIRIIVFQRAVEYSDTVIAMHQKCIEEGSDEGTDVTTFFYHSDVLPYKRSAVIKYYAISRTRILRKLENYMRMERSLFPPIWLIILRRRRREQENAAEATKSICLSQDSDPLHRPLLCSSNNEMSTRYGSTG